ncbi:hypothetical protein HOF65_07415 [bacterium]|nr:hypothetical protein [bacterium]MBT3853742.1 hypothetical protein [bacterium]
MSHQFKLISISKTHQLNVTQLEFIIKLSIQFVSNTDQVKFILLVSTFSLFVCELIFIVANV